MTQYTETYKLTRRIHLRSSIDIMNCVDKVRRKPFKVEVFFGGLPVPTERSPIGYMEVLGKSIDWEKEQIQVTLRAHTTAGQLRNLSEEIRDGFLYMR